MTGPRFAGSAVTWATADDATRERWTRDRLFWYYLMRMSGGPDGSDLDAVVEEEAREAADWYGPRLAEAAKAAARFPTLAESIAPEGS